MVVDVIFNYAAATVSDNTEGNSSLSTRLAEPQLTQMPWAAISFAPDGTMLYGILFFLPLFMFRLSDKMNGNHWRSQVRVGWSRGEPWSWRGEAERWRDLKTLHAKIHNF